MYVRLRAFVLAAMVTTASVIAFADGVHAATHNQFGLVYKGAIMENTKGKASIHPVTYTLSGLKIAANVYTPAGYGWPVCMHSIWRNSAT